MYPVLEYFLTHVPCVSVTLVLCVEFQSIFLPMCPVCLLQWCCGSSFRVFSYSLQKLPFAHEQSIFTSMFAVCFSCCGGRVAFHSQDFLTCLFRILSHSVLFSSHTPTEYCFSVYNWGEKLCMYSSCPAFSVPVECAGTVVLVSFCDRCHVSCHYRNKQSYFTYGPYSRTACRCLSKTVCVSLLYSDTRWHYLWRAQ
jgi:multidrug transporter EmrE-like cation transporter